MTALGIEVVTLAFPNPDLSESIDTNDFSQVNASLSFSFSESGNIRTLSTTDASAGIDITGLLYTPVPSTALCPQWPLYVPKNATEVALPRATFGFIALAPWISSNCTLAYLAAVQQDPIRSFVFYLPGNSTDTPPLANDATWALGDGGKWKSTNKFPVYAVTGNSGNQIMSQLALYTGNLTSVPNGHELANLYPPSDYIRLALQVDTSGDSNLPSLWVFLLIVLGILIIIIGSSSFAMHCIQRKRRDQLRRRVASGQVDLEALGIKRLTVPQDILDKLPLHTYVSSDTPPATDPETSSSSAVRNSDASSSSTSSPRDADKPTPTSELLPFSQPTCAICLDDFVSNTTVVRELPCTHIFHPSCIDEFLRENSSLCPMCKKTVLPRGYCPATVTNAMVRRERMVRRTGQRRVREERGDDVGVRWRVPSLTVLPNTLIGGRRVFRGRREEAQPEVEMGSAELLPATMPGVEVPVAVAAPAENEGGHGQLCGVPATRVVAQPERPGQREGTRQRALAMLGRNRAVEGERIEEGARQRPGWRRVVELIWPGLS